MQDLRARAIGEQPIEWREIQSRQRIHEKAIGVGRELHEAQLRVIGAFAQELGVEREAPRTLHAEHCRLECGLGRD